MSSNAVVSQSNNLSTGKTFSETDSKAEIKEKIYEIKYSDPNLAISVCLNALAENIPLGPNLFSLYLYSTLGELYLKKNLPVLLPENINLNCKGNPLDKSQPCVSSQLQQDILPVG